MNFYIGFSYFEEEAGANHIQTKETFSALCKLDDGMVGIFLGSCRTIFSRIRNNDNYFLVDFRNIFFYLLFRIEKIFSVSIFRRNLLGLMFAIYAAKIVSRQKGDAHKLYIRQGNMAEFLYFARKLGKKCQLVFEIHDLEYSIPSFYNCKFEINRDRDNCRKFFELVEKNENIKIVSLTHSLSRIIKEEFGFKKEIAIIPDAHNFLISETKPVVFKKDKIYIIYSGISFGKNKGIEYLVDSLYLLNSRFIVELVGGSEKDCAVIRKKYADLVSDGRLVVLGKKSYREIPEFLKSADIAVIPLPPGGFSNFTSPLKLFEYMSVGLPIVASDVPTTKEILSDGINAKLFRAGSAADLARTITDLTDDELLGRRIGFQAFVDSKNYTYHERAKKIINLL